MITGTLVRATDLPRPSERYRALLPVRKAEQRQRFDIMTWSDLRQLVSHPILPALDRQEFDCEVGESRRRWLESTLGRDVELFCFPNGAENELCGRSSPNATARR